MKKILLIISVILTIPIIPIQTIADEFNGYEISIEKNFENRNLKGMCFEGANLEGANFENADLDKANFRNANLKLQKVYKWNPYTKRGFCIQGRRRKRNSTDGRFVGW